jgi:hypothetical protein
VIVVAVAFSPSGTLPLLSRRRDDQRRTRRRRGRRRRIGGRCRGRRRIGGRCRGRRRTGGRRRWRGALRWRGSRRALRRRALIADLGNRRRRSRRVGGLRARSRGRDRRANGRAGPSRATRACGRRVGDRYTARSFRGRPSRAVRRTRGDVPNSAAGSQRSSPEVPGGNGAADQHNELECERIATHVWSIPRLPDGLS